MPTNHSLLIRNAEIDGLANQDVLITAGQIKAVGSGLAAPASAETINARGGALLPGLKDHHLHLASLAVAGKSLSCSPSTVVNADGFRQALARQASKDPNQWVRGVGYSESVAGEIDADWLDAVLPNTPARIQHRGGRLWVLNSAAMKALQVTDADPLERENGHLTGRLYEGDVWLRERMTAVGEAGFPDLSAISRELASYGITAVTDTSPDNNKQTLQHFAASHAAGHLLQDLRMMGNASLDAVQSDCPGITVGEHKFHLLESNLPDLQAVVAGVAASHAAGRGVAFHCVTRTELMFALAAFEEAGSRKGDRIEHASVTHSELLPVIRQLGLTVVTQPGLIFERGDHYLASVDADDHSSLYRLRAFMEAGIPLAGSSDAPYTDPNPWLGMQAAIDRVTRSGVLLGQREALTVRQALALYTGDLDAPAQASPGIRPGQRADICLLSQPWQAIRNNLAMAEVVLTLKAGRVIWRYSVD